MVKYPYNIDIWYESEANLNSDGTWSEGNGYWRNVGRCNVRQNGRGSEVTLSDGKVVIPSFEVSLPSYIAPIPIGTKVRISERGKSVLSCQCNEDIQAGIDEYRVLGYKPYKQRFASRILWL